MHTSFYTRSSDRLPRKYLGRAERFSRGGKALLVVFHLFDREEM